ncbi:MAG: choice-of-anchor D domain-containing protein [Bryobacteraceae bacterium]
MTYRIALLAVLVSAAGTLAQGQQVTDLAVGYLIPPENNFIALPHGGKLTFPAVGIGRSLTATVVIGNRGTGRASVNAIALAGEGFLLTGVPALPAALESGRELRIGVVFIPSKPVRATGSLTVTFGDSSFRAELEGSTAASEILLTYTLPSEGNVIPVSSGGSLVFPATRSGTTASATVGVGNRGLGGGTVTEISVSGERFRLTGLPSLPVFVDSGRELRFGVLFDARDLQTATGMLRIVVDQQTFVVNLEGPATGPRYAYEAFANGTASVVASGTKLSLPETALRETNTLTIEVRNTGNAEGSIPGISVVGDGFQLADLPFFPYVMLPEAAFSFQVIFSPRQPGKANGRLRIGADVFDLEATATGTQLTYSYRTSGVSTELRDSRTILWPPVELGLATRVDLLIRNTGNRAATVTAILIIDSRAAFKVASPVALPAVIEPGSERIVPIDFSPSTPGELSARLHIDGDTFSLIGVGAPLPPLPAVEVHGASPAQEALQQKPITVSLAETYPLPLTGTLTLSLSSDKFALDPAVQLSTGGRVVTFTIPANEKQARFPTGSEVYFQTGTVAGTLQFKTALAARGIDVTPASPPGMEVVVAPAVPRVLDVQMQALSANSLAVVVTGLSTTRSLRQVEVEFAASPKYNVPAGKFTLDISTTSDSWYRRRDSEAYGSLFTASIPFSVQANNGVNLEEVFQSVTATLSNEMGRSNSMTSPARP